MFLFALPNRNCAITLANIYIVVHLFLKLVKEILICHLQFSCWMYILRKMQLDNFHQLHKPCKLFGANASRFHTHTDKKKQDT